MSTTSKTENATDSASSNTHNETTVEEQVVKKEELIKIK